MKPKQVIALSVFLAGFSIAIFGIFRGEVDVVLRKACQRMSGVYRQLGSTGRQRLITNCADGEVQLRLYGAHERLCRGICKRKNL